MTMAQRPYDPLRSSHGSLYPAQIADELRGRWTTTGNSVDALPPQDVLTTFLDILYQASLLREEGQPVRCRVALAPPSAFEIVPPEGVDRPMVCRFDTPATFSAHDIRKLACASGYYRSLLGVEIDASGALRIWGMVMTGTHWVDRVDGGRLVGNPLPQELIVHVVGAGHLRMVCGYERVLETAAGLVLAEGFDPFHSKWLPLHFRSVRHAMIEDMLLSGGQTLDICDSFVKDAAQSVARRALTLMRSRGRGGLLVFLPDNLPQPELDRWLRFRVRFKPSGGSQQYGAVMRRLLARLLSLAAQAGLEKITWDAYRQLQDADLTALENQLIEFAHVMADLMSVDGALVLDRRFSLIGFGCEILGDHPVRSIHRALDLEAEYTVEEAADRSGTRHRSTYRLVAGMEGAMAVVVSQDRNVRFVARHNGRLTYWPYLP